VLDYLSQLALRVQQSEFAVQPRPVSQFESRHHSIPTTPESSVLEEADERGVQSAIFIPTENDAERYAQPADSHIPRETDTLDSFSEVQPTKRHHNLYPAQSTVTPPIVAAGSSTETADLSVVEVAHPAPHRQQAEQSERITRSVVAQAQSLVRIDKGASATNVPSKSSAEATDSLVLEVPRPVSRRPQTEQSERIVRSAVVKAQPSARIDRQEQQASKASPDPLGRPDRSEFIDLVVQGKNEWQPSIVRIDISEGERAPSPMTRARNHSVRGTFSDPTDTEPLFGRKAEVATKSGLAPASRREHPQPLGDRTAPQFGQAHATNEPTIQVTIGRVEIRATVLPTPTRKTPTHRSAMSLDDYLKQRNGSRG